MCKCVYVYVYTCVYIRRHVLTHGHVRVHTPLSGGGVGSTVPEDGGVVHLTVPVNAYVRLTHVFLSLHYYATHYISIHSNS